MKKILFLHGMFGQNSSKPEYIQSLGYKVCSPILSDWNFSKSLEQARLAFEASKPDLIVGSSRGGAIAMNIDSQEVPLVLLAPAWSFFGNKRTTKKNSIILHSEYDNLVPISYSVELSQVSECELIIVGQDHRLNCSDARKSLKLAIEKHT